MNVQRILSRKQGGAVLVVSLVMLLLLTLLGLSAMRSATLSERMAGNLRDRMHALQAAEAALRAGEGAAEQAYDDNDLESLDGQSDVTLASFPGVAQRPRYRAEVVARLRTSTEIGAVGDEGAAVRVVARGFGVTADAQVELQSIYVVEE